MKCCTRVLVMVEDAGAGYQFFEAVLGTSRCISAEGNAQIYAKMITEPGKNGLLVIADGAAFGAYIDQVIKLRSIKKHIALYFPESFEWMILKSDVLANADINKVLLHPENYIDSSEYVSWERFFTAFLIKKTLGDKVRQYSKSELPKFYSSGKNATMILNVLPEEVRRLL